jgi:hypothetical protein
LPRLRRRHSRLSPPRAGREFCERDHSTRVSRPARRRLQTGRRPARRRWQDGGGDVEPVESGVPLTTIIELQQGLGPDTGQIETPPRVVR